MSKTIIAILVLIMVLVLIGLFVSLRQTSTPTVTTPLTTSPTATSTPIPTATPTATPKATATPTAPAKATSTASPATQTKQQTTVTYSDSGFSPATLPVKAGTKVTFKNESTQQMWVASDPHPIHNGLPGFDERAGVSKGGAYSFTFTKTGTFGYHNHLNPSDTGTIVVQ